MVYPPNKKSADWQSALGSAVAKQLTTAAGRNTAPFVKFLFGANRRSAQIIARAASLVKREKVHQNQPDRRPITWDWRAIDSCQTLDTRRAFVVRYRQQQPSTAISYVRARVMGYQEHEQRAAAEAPAAIRCGVITISDTRTPETDTSGATIRMALEAQGHTITHYQVVKDEPDQIAALVRQLAGAGCQVILTNGGTGITRRDSTFEAIDALLEKRLPGFGELFRMLSYADIGPAAMLSRATAGTFGGALIFCLPGSTGAVKLALEKLIIPELPHLVWEILRQ